MKILPSRLLATFLLCAPALASAVTIPYTENYDDEILGTAAPSELNPESGQFATSAGGSWSVVAGGIAGNLAYQNTYSATTATSSNATINFAGALGGTLTNDFAISTEFTLDTFTVSSSNITVGLGALGVNSTFGGTSSSAYYLADFLVNESTAVQDIGRIRIVEVGTGGTLVQAGSGLSINSTDAYRMTLQGAYVPGGLELTFTVENLTAGTSSTVSFTDSSPTVGTHFGYRNRINGNGTLDVNFDNFSVVAIPEPGSAALLGVGFLGLIARRRRK